MIVLILRFSSIGDVVLTSPILRCIKEQKKCTVHYVIKRDYLKVIENSPHIDRFYVFDQSIKEVLPDLKKVKFDFIFDLQNNFKSFLIKTALKSKVYTVNKKNWKKILLIYFHRDVLKDHVVDRYFECIQKAGFYNDNKGLEYNVPLDVSVKFNLTKPFIVWSIGASYFKKKLSSKQITEVCNQFSYPIFLIGGLNEKDLAESIMKNTTNLDVRDYCGRLSLDQSAYLINKSNGVLTNDTGMMHIAAALNKKIISFWGCTKPSIGFSPLIDSSRSIIILSKKSVYPCSKHGNICRFQSEGCIKTISVNEIYDAVVKMDFF